MPGPTPSPSKTQRSNYDAWTILRAEGPTEDPPDLEGEHGDRAVRLWGHWWSTPMAHMWGRFDASQLERLLSLTEAIWEGDTPAAVLSEARQLEDRFGLSPSARRKLYWRVEGIDTPAADEALDAPGGGDVPLPKAGGEGDPRALRVVS